MPQTSLERGAAQASFRDAARALLVSGDTIDGFVASATPGQLSACRSMLEAELVHRDRARRQRLPGQARFPVPKSFDGFDWSNVSFPDGWGREDMCSLAFVRDAEDLSPKAPVTRTPASPTMAPYADEVRGWLEADGRAPVFRQPLVSQNSIRSIHTSA